MKILVCIKRVVDYNIRIQVKPDNSGVVTDGVKMSMNPFDEIAVEEALRLKESADVSEVIAVTIGGAESDEQLRTALAMGVDRVIRVDNNALELDKLSVARTLLAVVNREQPDLVLLGKQAIDEDGNQTGQMLAALWDRPQATFASKVELDDNKIRVSREVDAGLEVLEVDLPAVITSDLRLNEPRYVKLPALIQAKRKPIETLSLDELDVSPSQTVKVLEVVAPQVRQAGIKVNDVAELVDALKSKGVL